MIYLFHLVVMSMLFYFKKYTLYTLIAYTTLFVVNFIVIFYFELKLGELELYEKSAIGMLVFPYFITGFITFMACIIIDIVRFLKSKK